MDRNALFYRFALGLGLILVLYGAGMVAVILFGPQMLANRMIAGFGAMFTGVLGLGSGYLLGSRAGVDHERRDASGGE